MTLVPDHAESDPLGGFETVATLVNATPPNVMCEFTLIDLLVLNAVLVEIVGTCVAMYCAMLVFSAELRLRAVEEPSNQLAIEAWLMTT
ncbi:MAG: hypothetical protein IPJ28_13875 [Betaproteobacteria bacterium]|nr:hypothetical protein [Betaproteobacteria bacterium]